MVKTRQQLYGELSKTSRRPSALFIFVKVLRQEGVLSLWNGLSPALFRHFLYTGARMPLYEWVRTVMMDLSGEPRVPIKYSIDPGFGPLGPEGPESINSEAAHMMSFIKKHTKPPDSIDEIIVNNNGTIPKSVILRAALAGILSGAIAQLISSPADLLKIRRVQLQATNKRQSKGSAFAFMRDIIRKDGVLALWRGGMPNVQRAALVNMGEMTTYDTAKRWFSLQLQLEDGPMLHLCSSSLSAFVSSVLGTPTDLVKTRMMRQLPAVGSSQQMDRLMYRGMIDCATKVVQTEGFFALYRGFFLMWARMAPWSLTFWLTYEQLRKLAGQDGF